MTNEDLSKQVQNLADIVATLAETMNAKFDQIDTQLSNIRKDHKNLTDIVKDMELRIDKRFAEVDEQFAKVNERFVKVDEHFAKLETGQTVIRTNIADLRHDIFIEEGSREQVDNTIFEEQKQNYESLDKRLRLLETKFHDLAQKTATIA
jgi:SMC interacting uncharacterized protein involved in chromosome segregation